MTKIKLPPPSTKPFDFQGRKLNFLLIHGYTGTPYDLLPLGIYLNELGFSATAPLLKGHGTDPRDIDKVHYKDWMNQAQDSLNSIANDNPIILIGLSMGGLIASILAARNLDRVIGLVLLAPAFRLKPIGQLGMHLSKFGLYRVFPLLNKAGKCDVRDEEARRIDPTYQQISIKGLQQLHILQKMALKALPEIECPCFAAFGSHDKTVDSNYGAKQLKKTHAPYVEQHFLPNSQHVISLDLDREKLFDLITNFSEKILNDNDPRK